MVTEEQKDGSIVIALDAEEKAKQIDCLNYLWAAFLHLDAHNYILQERLKHYAAGADGEAAKTEPLYLTTTFTESEQVRRNFHEHREKIYAMFTD